MTLCVTVSGDVLSGWLVDIEDEGSSRGSYAQSAPSASEAAERALATHRETLRMQARNGEREQHQSQIKELSKKVADLAEQTAAALAENDRLRSTEGISIAELVRIES